MRDNEAVRQLIERMVGRQRFRVGDIQRGEVLGRRLVAEPDHAPAVLGQADGFADRGVPAALGFAQQEGPLVQALGRDVAMAERQIRQLADQRGGRAVFIACDDPIDRADDALLDIVGFTLLQRGCRNEERAAVFAIFEGALRLGAVAITVSQVRIHAAVVIK